MNMTEGSVQAKGSRLVYYMTMGTKYNIVVEGYQNEGQFNLTVKKDSEQSSCLTFPNRAKNHDTSCL
jgi:hypothetical protein